MWLVEHMLSFSDKILGCEMIFPDTVFFKDGKPFIIVRMDKELCLYAIKSGSKLTH